MRSESLTHSSSCFVRSSSGPMITILMLLSSLNSFVNPFIYLFFNQNLVKSLLGFCCRMKFNDQFILGKTNASEVNSNYENRNDTQSSTHEDEANRVHHRNGNVFALKHGMSDKTKSCSPRSSRFRHFQTSRRSCHKQYDTDLDSSYDSMAVNV